MTDKELNKEICRELQKVAVSLVDTCKCALKKSKGYFLTGELVKLYNEKPWVFMSKFGSDHEAAVCVGDFRCSFCIGSVFKLLSKFEKLSGTKETVFEITEEQLADGLHYDVVVGELPAGVTKERVTRYARNGNDIVNRNMHLTRVSDEVYTGGIDGSGWFDTYLKTPSGMYYIGAYSSSDVSGITLDRVVSMYTLRIASYGSFGLIDLRIIADIMPERLNEANECRAEYLKLKEVERNEAARVVTEERDRKIAESQRAKEDKKAYSKAKSMDKANNARLEKRLAKLVRYNGVVLTVKEYLNSLKNDGHKPALSEKSSVQYSRTKYNRMGYIEQQEYDRKLAIKVPMYIAETGNSFFELSKLEFEYFSSLFKECDTTDNKPQSDNDTLVDVLDAPGIQEALSKQDSDPVRNVVCIECEPEDIPDYWDYLDSVPVPETSTSAPVCIDTLATQELKHPPVVFAGEQLLNASSTERHLSGLSPERLRSIPLALRRYLITGKGMYYLIA